MKLLFLYPKQLHTSLNNEVKEKNMQRLMERVNERISKGILDMDAWFEDLIILEETLTKWLNEKGYDATIAMNDRVSLSDHDTDTRLNYAEQLLQTIQTDKEKGLIQGVHRAKSKMEKILEYYNIGHIKEFHLKHTGLYIELYLGFMPYSMMDDKKETKRLKSEKQLDIIKQYGFDIGKKKHRNNDVGFRNTDQNKELFVDLLASFGISCLEFHSSESELLKVSGKIDLEKLYAYVIPNLKIAIDEETEKKNKLIFLDKRIKELYHSIATTNSMPNMIQTCGYLAEHYLVDIYKTLGFNTPLCQKVENYHKEERLKNQRIREIEEKIGETLSGTELIKLGKLFIARMGHKGLKELGFDISHETSCIDSYGINLCFRAVSIDHMMYSFDIYERIAEENDKEGEDVEEKTVKFIERTFDLIEPFREERYIAYTEKNVNYIMDWVNTNFHTTVESLEVGNKRNLLYIKSFSVRLDSLELV